MTGQDQATHSEIQSYFEQGFLKRPLLEQIEDVKRYYLFDQIRVMAATHQPMLEAGCGPGQWVAWAASEGWEAIGVDWSPELMERAEAQGIPGARFLVGDLRNMPLADASVGSIMSLGAVEHAIEGPEAALQEFARVLRPGGPCLVTVPYLGPVRRVVWSARRPIKYSAALRRALGRTRGTKPLLRDPGTRPGWTADFLATEDGWTFYQYQLDRATMRQLLTTAEFVIDQEFTFAPEEGVIQTFPVVGGKYGDNGPRLSAAGRMLHRFLPAGAYEHMLGYMVHKSHAESAESEQNESPRGPHQPE